MAMFSKEFCEKDDTMMPYDFSIEEEWKKLENWFYIPFICEEYGFTFIEKENDKIQLVFRNYNSNKWKNWEEVIDLKDLDSYYLKNR